jgi:putative transcriptional regulator
MSKIGESLLRGAEDALAFVRGDKTRGRLIKVKATPRLDVRAVRRDVRLTQVAFARWLGVDLKTYRAWERGTAEPEGPARKLLWIVAGDPEIVRQRSAAE